MTTESPAPPAAVTAAPTACNPYLNAKRAWNEHMGHILSTAQTWQVVGILGLMMGVTGIGGALYCANRSQFIPYIIEVDRRGQVLAAGRVDQSTTVDDRMIHAALANFIADARLVTPDSTVQRDAIFRVYALLATQDAATTKMNDWLNGTEAANPFKRAKTEMVAIEITSVLQQSPGSWQVEWQETVRQRNGTSKHKFIMRALVTVYIVAPTASTTESQWRRNPLGIYVKDFDWAKQSGVPS